MKLLSLLLAPVSRIHSYLSHIQVSQQPRRCTLQVNRKHEGGWVRTATQNETSNI